MQQPRDIFSWPKYWAECFGTAGQLPMSRAEMERLGWDACDIIIVTGDAYVDLPSFGMAVIGRLLEAQGFRVGIISQPDWKSADDFRQLGKPNLFFGVTAGNMDSMVNHYTSEKRIRSNDAYTLDGAAGKRPDRAVTVYAQRCREAFKGVPVIIGGIEASLRRIAHYDYWSDKVRHSVLPDAKADVLVFGNGERQIVEIAHRLAAGESIKEMHDIRGTAVMRNDIPDGWSEIDARQPEEPVRLIPHPDPYTNVGPISPSAKAGAVLPIPEADEDIGPTNTKRNTCNRSQHCTDSSDTVVGAVSPLPGADGEIGPTMHEHAIDHQKQRTVIRLPSFEQVRDNAALYAHASRLMHLETNPGNARALVQQHGTREVWINPPPWPLTTKELDGVFELPYSRRPHASYGSANIPAYAMIRFSVNIMRGCFGGCTFCSITEHEGRIIQSRSENSVAREVAAIRDHTPGFTGTISDLGGPTANMYRLACKSETIEAACRRLSCVYPGICKNLNTDHAPLIRLYRRIRKIKGIKRALVASGLRYDLAVHSPEYIEELVTHHVGGYLKIAPEHTETGPLSHMMKPGIESFDRFKKMFDAASKKAGKKQYLIPYFIAAHPGTTDEDMVNLALWLKAGGYKPDQVQAFLPSPMATASAMYHSGFNPLRRIRKDGERVCSVTRKKQRDLHKALLRYHDPHNWPLLRDALKKMGRSDLIGHGPEHLVPPANPKHIAPGRKISPPKHEGRQKQKR